LYKGVTFNPTVLPQFIPNLQCIASHMQQGLEWENSHRTYLIFIFERWMLFGSFATDFFGVLIMVVARVTVFEIEA